MSITQKLLEKYSLYLKNEESNEKLYNWAQDHEDEIESYLSDLLSQHYSKETTQNLIKSSFEEIKNLDHKEVFWRQLYMVREHFFNIILDLVEIEEEDNMLVLHRAVTIENAKKYIIFLKKETEGYKEFLGLGLCWSYDKEKAEAHHGSGNSEEEIILTAHVPFESIDLEATFSCWDFPILGEEECEIRLLKGSEIYLKEILYKEKEIIVIQKHLA